MSSLSRRRFLQAGTVTAGAAIVTAKSSAASAATEPAAAHSATVDYAVAREAADAPVAADPLMLFVSDTAGGDVTVLTGGREVVYHDPQLVARIQRVVRRAQV